LRQLHVITLSFKYCLCPLRLARVTTLVLV